MFFGDLACFIVRGLFYYQGLGGERERVSEEGKRLEKEESKETREGGKTKRKLREKEEEERTKRKLREN